jgi:UDPglucose--hexose-1-phosphate uridylyltransferase
MASPIEFRRERKAARLHDPRHDFALRTVESEIRWDPLTGDSGRICHFAFNSTPPADLDDLVAASAATCPFCGDKVNTVTPTFAGDEIPEGRLRHGEAVLFPNLFPYDDVSAVAVVSQTHFLPMDDVPEQAVVDGLGVARAFFDRCGPDAAPRWSIVNWNYMPPSGGSQIHPHMQVVHTGTPGNAILRQQAAERAWRGEFGRPYAAQLIEAEHAAGERWIGEIDGVAFIAPFVPTGVLGDVTAIFPHAATIADLDQTRISAFARGLRRVLRGFAAKGLWSFNLVLFPAPVGADASTHWLAARIVPRLYINPALHVTDVAYMPLLLDERFAMTWPEETAEHLRPFVRDDAAATGPGPHPAAA